MEEEVRDASANGPEEPTPPSIGRRQLLQALGVTAGALAATTFLPDGWVQPAVAAKPPKPTPPAEYPPPFPPTATVTPTPTATPTPTPTPPPTPVLPSVGDLSITGDLASFSYGSPMIAITDSNTVLTAQAGGKIWNGTLQLGRYQLNLSREGSATEGTISFHVNPIVAPRVVKPACVVNATQPLSLWVQLSITSKSNMLSNSSTGVCIGY